MKLSKRMEMILDIAGKIRKRTWSQFDFVESGCDHAYLSIELLKRGYARKVYAMDIVEGPLRSARENIERELGKTEYEFRIETRLSDGLVNLKEGEADALLIAGMGGGTILHILTERNDLVSAMKCLILQPQSEIDQVRRYLVKQGFWILFENMVEEDGKFYSVIGAVREDWFMLTQNPDEREKTENKAGKELSEEEYLFGPVNLREKNEVLHVFLLRKEKKLEQILRELANAQSERTKESFLRVQKEYSQIKSILRKLF